MQILLPSIYIAVYFYLAKLLARKAYRVHYWKITWSKYNSMETSHLETATV